MVQLLRRLLPFVSVVAVAAVAYDGWFLYSRWRDTREAERMRRAEEARLARQTIDTLGGGKLKILEFYAIPATIRRGGRANICYGVYGAKSVRIDPPVERLHPTITHCFEVSPSKTTDYKLVAEDASGHTAAEQFTLRVVP